MSYMLSWVRFQALAKTYKWKTKKTQAEQSAETSTESYAPHCSTGWRAPKMLTEIQMASDTGSCEYHLRTTEAPVDIYSTVFEHIQPMLGSKHYGIFMPSPQRQDNAMRRTPGTLRMRPNKAKILLRRVLISPRKQKPIKSPMMPGRLPMIGKAMVKPKSMLAWNHATCAIAQITPETNEGRTSWRGMWLCFLCVTT